MSIVVSKSELDRVQWHELINNSATSSFFQTPECYDFYASLPFLTPFVFGVLENEKLVAVLCGYIIAEGNLIKQYFSRRAIVPGGVLLDNSISDSALTKLLSVAIKELSRKAIYIELRNYNDYSSVRSILEKNKFEYKSHLNFHVNTSDVEMALKQLSVTKRRDVKLSRKEGAEWYATTDMLDVEKYYKILDHLYKTRIKTPLFPLSFFENLVRQPFGKLFIVKRDGQILGGSVCVLLPERTVYEWFVCGLDGQIKNVFPSTVATWAAIEYAATNGYARFDMMGAGKPDEGYGVREFKAKFGGELVENGRFLFICKPRLFALGAYIVKRLKRRK